MNKKYLDQMVFLREIAEKLGVVMYKPNYHAKKGDKNTVLFYFKEDDDYNRKVDTECAGLSQESKNSMYHRHFFAFENTDFNGRYSQDYANHGKILLNVAEWKAQLEGAFELAYYKALQSKYIASVGGVDCLEEADDKYNDLNRDIIKAFYKQHSKACIGSINYYDKMRTEIILGTAKAVYEYDGSKLCNFGCGFIIPQYSEELNDLIRQWNVNHTDAKQVEEILDKVTSLGGEFFLWK